MQLRKEMFSATKPAPSDNVIAATVRHRIDKRAEKLAELTPNEKMLCALRKVLVKLGDEDAAGCRYYITDNRVHLIRPPVSTVGKAGDAQTYTAQGRCRLGVIHKLGHISTKVIEFNLTFRDVIDDRGLADLIFIEPTTIDELPANTVMPS